MRFGIVNAMAEEKKELVAAMTAATVRKEGQETFYVGQIGQHEVVLVESGIGKVAATIATTVLINTFEVDVIINSGSAGALGQDLRIGDVVVADALVYGDADARAFGYEYGQVPQQPAQFIPDEALSAAIGQVFEEAMAGQLYRGLIVTSDSFIAGPEQKDHLLAHFPTALSAEMEGAAIAQTASFYQVPFVVIRAISDNANGEAGPTFDEFIWEAGKRSAEGLIAYLKTV
ncbi:5'-methylthioadenosine/adenosylhomocysteine nucleosidase [Weissella halotolerans]|uniref:adenosylhomocysteine nucleosidase n=1 Tax=Weissella halotolerans DSM 20190 TaxID=1123500 RepID=A0A0R2FTM2_9LACO|nr:5'-methylthioadenosine/adenosylhomocysteine nucleosidase [Weissella halotolerans]KRN31791.1 methylthioadenosine nucleosidase [Weissella halotolerans DSM 20190]